MKGLNGWVRLLEGNQSAVLSTLLKELDRITASDESSLSQLAEVILKDANLTSNVIRVGNSVQFNAGSAPVTTVSRAILNIGFKHIRSVCFSIKILEAVLKDSASDLLVSRLATTLHGAAQAKALLSEKPPHTQEEVFVASLLSHLTELLVLSSDEDDAKEYAKDLSPTSTLKDKNQIAEKTLGVSLTRLSKTLMKRWRIEGMVSEVFLNPDKPSDEIKSIQLGDEISRAALLGWDSLEFKAVLKSVAEFQKQSVSEAIKKIQQTAEDAAEAITQYGKGVLDGQIPTKTHKVEPRKVQESSEPLGSTDDKTDDDKTAVLLMPSANFQLKVLQELTSQLTSDFNINKIFKTALLGINRGVGMERAALVLFDKSQLKLVAKYVQGEATKPWLESFVVPYSKSESGFLYQLFKQDKVTWVGHSDHKSISQYLSKEYMGITGTEQFFIAPLIAKGRKIGFIYADLGLSKRELSDDYFNGFNHFMQQVKLALTVLASR